MNEEEENVALPDDYTEQKCCGSCIFRKTIGDPDIHFCDFTQDYRIKNLWYEQWIKAKEVKMCGICGNYKREE